MWAHIEKSSLLLMPGKVLCRVPAAPLWQCEVSCRSGPTYDKTLPNHTQRLIQQMLLRIRRRKAPRKCPAQPDTAFPYARAQHGGDVRLRTLCSLRTGIPLSPLPEPGPEAGQFQRGGFLICAALLLRRSQPERRICARPLRKRAGAAPQSRSRRGGLTRLAVCTVPA